MEGPIFYFTSNSPIYWIAETLSSTFLALHALMEAITLLTIEFGCFLWEWL